MTHALSACDEPLQTVILSSGYDKEQVMAGDHVE